VFVVGGIDIRDEILARDLGSITGLDALKEVETYASFTELCETAEVDVVLHTAGSPASISLEQMQPMIEKGIAVISSCEEFVFPRHRAPAETDAADAACQQSGARILGIGVNPGFALDMLPICLSGMCADVHSVYGERVVNASTRRQPLQKKVGSGMAPEAFEALGNAQNI
jgi:hypothetical protein